MLGAATGADNLAKWRAKVRNLEAKKKAGTPLTPKDEADRRRWKRGMAANGRKVGLAYGPITGPIYGPINLAKYHAKVKRLQANKKAGKPLAPEEEALLERYQVRRKYKAPDEAKMAAKARRAEELTAAAAERAAAAASIPEEGPELLALVKAAEAKKAAEKAAKAHKDPMQRRRKLTRKAAEEEDAHRHHR